MKKCQRAWIIVGVPSKPTADAPQPDTLQVPTFLGGAEDDGDDNTVDGYDLTSVTYPTIPAAITDRKALPGNINTARGYNATGKYTHKNPHKLPVDVDGNLYGNNPPHKDSAQGGGFG